MPDEAPLSDLLGVTAAEFRQLMMTSTPRVAAGRFGLGNTFSFESADQLLSDPRLPLTTVRVTRDGQDVPQVQYTLQRTNLIGKQEQYADGRRLSALLGSGHTIVLGALHRFFGPTASLARGLARQLGQPVSINAYVTPPSSQGLKPHYDVQDVIVVQVSGSKRWRLGPSEMVQPIAGQAWHLLTQSRRDKLVEVAAAEMKEVNLQPGDAMFFPRGYLHSATAADALSIHLTIGISTVTRLDVLRSAVDRLAADDWARQPWFGAGDLGNSELQRLVDTGVERLQDALRAGQLDSVPAAVAQDAWHDQPAAPVAVLRQGLTVPGHTEELYELVDQVGLELSKEDDGSVLVKSLAVSMKLPEALRPGVELLLSGSPATFAQVEDLCGAPAAGKVIRAMLNGGLIRAVPAEH